MGSYKHFIYSLAKLKLLNTSDPLSLLAATGKRTNLIRIIAQNDGIITIKTPLNGVLRRPGCYVCKSSLLDEDGVTLMQWDWWFELRGKTPKIEKEIVVSVLQIAMKVQADRHRQTFFLVQLRAHIIYAYHATNTQIVCVYSTMSQPGLMESV